MTANSVSNFLWLFSTVAKDYRNWFEDNLMWGMFQPIICPVLFFGC
jgi:hypothetical protein